MHMILQDVLTVCGAVAVVAGAVGAVFTAIGKIRVAAGRKRLGRPVASDTPNADPDRRPWVIGIAARPPQPPVT